MNVLMSGRIHISIGLVSVSIIGFQIILMQILSVLQWYHYAYMIISIALLGFGASGTFIALFKEWLLKRFEIVFPATLLMCGFSMSIVVSVSQTILGGFDAYLLFLDSSHLIHLMATYLLYFIPFFFGALAIGLTFIKHVENIGGLYFSNLIGSGLGGITAVILFWFVFPNQLPALIASLSIVAGAIVITRNVRVYFLPPIIFSLLICGATFFNPPPLIPSEYKSLSKTLNLPETEIFMERSSPLGLVQVVSSPLLRFAPGVSLSYSEEYPVYDVIFNNAEWFGVISEWEQNQTKHILNYTTGALPYVLEDRHRILILNTGTGTDITHALSTGATDVVAVEPHTVVISLLRNEFTDLNDSLFHLPSVEVRNKQPRTFLAANRETYDLILLPTLEVFGGTAGMHALMEQYILTKEAFHQIINLLNEDGVIAITSWMDYPVRNPLKILATLVEVLEESGVENPRHHIAAVRSWGTITFLLKRTPLTGKEIKNIREFSKKMMFDPALLPGIKTEERERYNKLQDAKLFEYIDEIMENDREKFYREYDFHVRPATDDRPFFSQFLRWRSLPYLAGLFGMQAVPFLEVGYIIVAVTLVQVVLAATFLILLPLFKLGWKGGNKSWALLYFSGLGVGFMFIEIVLIHKFILYLGQPVYSAAIVITSLLICSGIGSYYSSGLSSGYSTLRNITGTVAFIIIIYIFLLDTIISSTISSPLELKMIFTLLIIAPLGFIMGIPFPSGLRYLSGRHKSQLPWAWGINGSLSVISAALATILAVELGFTVVMGIAAGAYIVACIVCLRG